MNNASALRTDIIRGDVRLSKPEQARELWLQTRTGTLVDALDGGFSWRDSEGEIRQTTQSKRELGQISVSCGDEKTKPVFTWEFQTR